jgi:hypothetical protein
MRRNIIFASSLGITLATLLVAGPSFAGANNGQFDVTAKMSRSLSGPDAENLSGGSPVVSYIGGVQTDTPVDSIADTIIIGGAQADNDRLDAGARDDTCANEVGDLSCDPDTTGPEISDVTLPSVVNAGDPITVTWRITDASGIDTLGAGPNGGFGPNTQVMLTGSPGFVFWSGCDWGVARISGSSTDGVYEANCTVPAGVPNATYAFAISAADIVGNAMPGYSRFFEFEVQNGSSDYDPPSVSYESGLADSYLAGDDVTFTLRGIDETGVAGIAVFVLGPNGRLVDEEIVGWIDASETTLISGTERDGVYTVHIKLAATAIPGEYSFLLGYSDTIGNRAWNEVGYPLIVVNP